jgi:alpha-glucuronidase
LYEVDVEYFDVRSGVSQFRFFIGDKLVDEWRADLSLPGEAPSADSSVRHRIKGLTLRPGDTVRIEGLPDHDERAPLDYIEIIPAAGVHSE